MLRSVALIADAAEGDFWATVSESNPGRWLIRIARTNMMAWYSRELNLADQA